MTKKRIMVKAKLHEISAVDRPAQPDAKVVLRKRHEVVNSSVGTKKNLSDGSIPAGFIEQLNSAGNEDMTPDQFVALQKRAERAEKALTLSTAERELFNKMSAADQDKFLTLSPELRAAEVTKAADSNPVVYTDTKGRAFRKSDDPRLVEMAKDADEARQATARSEERARLERVSKRASELSNLPGQNTDHVLLVEAVEKMTPEQQKAINTVLDKVNGEFAKAFSAVGTSTSPSTDSPEAKLEAMAKALQAKEPNLTDAQAYAKAARSPEGQKVYAEHVASQRGSR